MNLIRLMVLILVGIACSLPAQAKSINWTSLSEAQQKAAENNKKVMIYAEAEWCGYCKKMNEQVFPKQSVQDSLEKYFYPVRIDIESKNELTFNDDKYTEQELARRFQVSGTPTIIFVNPEGEVIGAQPGFLPADVFDKLLAFVGSDLTGTTSFEEYLRKHDVEL